MLSIIPAGAERDDKLSTQQLNSFYDWDLARGWVRSPKLQYQDTVFMHGQLPTNSAKSFNRLTTKRWEFKLGGKKIIIKKLIFIRCLIVAVHRGCQGQFEVSSLSNKAASKKKYEWGNFRLTAPYCPYFPDWVPGKWIWENQQVVNRKLCLLVGIHISHTLGPLCKCRINRKSDGECKWPAAFQQAALLTLCWPKSRMVGDQYSRNELITGREWYNQVVQTLSKWRSWRHKCRSQID